MVIYSSNTIYLSEGYDKKAYTILAEEIIPSARITGDPIHTLFNSPVTNENKKNENVIVNQVARTGIVAVWVDFEFTKFSPKKSEKNSYNFCFTKN
jgi:hypothetical protein